MEHPTREDVDCCVREEYGSCKGLPYYRGHRGVPYCVLHYPGYTEKITDFDAEINRRLNEKDYNFRGAWFPYPRSFQEHHFEDTADFSHATFNVEPGEEWGRTTHFSDSKFRSDVYFHGTKFCTETDFRRVCFEGDADFSGAIFEGRAEFTGEVHFDKQADFSTATFGSAADFSEACFGGGVRFSETAFHGGAYFSETVWRATGEDSTLDFSQSVFHQEAAFNYARFYAEKVVFSLMFSGGYREGSAAPFLGEAGFHGATFGGEYSGTSFGGNAYFSGVEFPREAEFSRATFCGETHFWSVTFHQNAEFYDTRFFGPAYFNENAKFLAGANFTEAKFTEGGRAGFVQAEFADTVAFDNAVLDDASFGSASFKEVRFAHATFGSADFSNTTFDEMVNFEETTWRRADFREAKFCGDTNFNKTTFENRVRFSETIFTGRVRFFGTETNRMFNPDTFVDFRDVRVHQPEQLTFHTVLLRPNWLVNAEVRNANFINVTWHGLPSRVKGSLDDEIGALQRRRVDSPHSLLAETCRDLYANYEEKRDYRTAGEFHYWSMDALRKESLRRFGFIRTLYGLLSGYGERPGQAFGVLVAIWLIFAALYFLLVEASPFWVSSASDVWQGIDYARQAMVYSLSALVRLNPRPQSDELDWFQTLVIIEGILGPLQIALFALAVRRKVMR